MDDAQPNDTPAVQPQGGGDTFAELYERQFASVYDYAIRLSHDRDIAALVVQSSFLRVRQNQSDPIAGIQEAPKLELFFAAHYEVAERLRQQRDAAQENDVAFAALDPGKIENTAAADQLPALAGLVWQAATSLRLNDYELLELSVRQGMDAGEIAAVLRTRPEAIENKLSDAHDGLESAFSSLIVIERGRRACVDLDFLIGEDAWSPSLQRRVGQHLQTCQTCAETRAGLPLAREMLSSLLPVAAPAGWQQTILDRLQNAPRTAASASVADAAGSQPPQRRAEPLPERFGGGGGELGDWVRGVFGGGGARGPLLGAALGALLTLIVLLTGLCVGGAFDGGGDGGDTATTPSPTATATASGSVTPTVTTTPTVTITPTPLPAEPIATDVPADTPVPSATATIEIPTAVPSSTPAATEPAPSPTEAS